MQGNDIQRCSIEKVSSLPSTNNFVGRIVCLVTPGTGSNPDTCMYFYYDEKGWFPFNNVVIDDTKINVIEGYDKVSYFSTISAAATYIKSNANLKSVIIGDNAGITSIGANAFDGCFTITSIILPNGITSIGNYAFFLVHLSFLYFYTKYCNYYW